MLHRKANPHDHLLFNSDGVRRLFSDPINPTEKVKTFSEKDFNRMIRRNRNIVGVLFLISPAFLYFLPQIAHALVKFL